jgi:glycosyltransferase involved in cell wall biosynthesis
VRILYLADAPYIHTVRVVRHFARLGHQCEVISFRPAEIEGAQVSYVGGFERLGKARYLLKARRVGALVRERAPDVLHALHLTSYGFLGALSGYHPFLLSVWGTDILEAPRLTPFHDWLTRYSLRHADEITATGLDLARQTARYAPPSRGVRVVPYGVDLGRFRPERRLDRERVVIGTAARLSPEKGLTYLLEAFALLKERFGGRVALRVAGDGPERGRLLAQARRLGLEVDWAGWVEHDALPAFLQSLDVFVLPSLYEGFGVAAVEASAMELPVVASRIDGIPDVVADGRTGVLAPPRDAGALAAAIGRLVEDAELRRAMGAAGREFVAERYDWDKNAAELEAIYARLAGAPAGARP